MIENFKIVEILNDDEPIEEERLAYLKEYIDEITIENNQLKQANKNLNYIIRDLKKNKNMLLYNVETILNNVQVELNEVLDKVECDRND